MVTGILSVAVTSVYLFKVKTLQENSFLLATIIYMLPNYLGKSTFLIIQTAPLVE
jgi:hypothetical protein